MRNVWIYYQAAALREAVEAAKLFGRGDPSELKALLYRRSNDLIACFRAYDGVRERAHRLRTRLSIYEEAYQGERERASQLETRLSFYELKAADRVRPWFGLHSLLAAAVSAFRRHPHTRLKQVSA